MNRIYNTAGGIIFMVLGLVKVIELKYNKIGV